MNRAEYLSSVKSIHEREVAHSMVVHEAGIDKFTQRELGGNEKNSLNDVIAQIQYLLVAPR